MDSDQMPPELIIVKSIPGTFLLSRDGRSYIGSANGYRLKLTFGWDGSGQTVDAELRDGHKVHTFVCQPFPCGHISDTIAPWLEEVTAERVENFAEEVQYFDSSDGRMAYWAYDTHLDTVPIVFVHGGPGGDSNPVKARRLCTGHPVYLFDQMGCGMSDPITDFSSWKVEDYIREMMEFIDSIPSEKVIIYGASWGAGLTLAYASATGCRKVSALILCSPFFSPRIWNEDAETNLRVMGGDYLERMRKCLENKDYGMEFKEILGEYNARYLFCLPEHREWALAAAEEEPNEVFRNLCGPNDMVTDGKLKDFDITPALDSLDIPVLFMSGDSDQVTVERMVAYHRAVKGSMISIIPRAGHVVASEQFDSYRDAILTFIRKLDESP